MRIDYTEHSLKINKYESIMAPCGTNVCINFSKPVLGIRPTLGKRNSMENTTLTNYSIEIPKKIRVESVGHTVFVDNLDSQQGGDLISFFVILDDIVQSIQIKANAQTSSDDIYIHDFK